VGFRCGMQMRISSREMEFFCTEIRFV
jgi:hypothetical protein